MSAARPPLRLAVALDGAGWHPCAWRSDDAWPADQLWGAPYWTALVEEAEAGLAVGDTPNLAARLQTAAGTNEVVIAPTTRRLVQDAFAMTDLGAQALKGIAPGNLIADLVVMIGSLDPVFGEVDR